MSLCLIFINFSRVVKRDLNLHNQILSCWSFLPLFNLFYLFIFIKNRFIINLGTRRDVVVLKSVWDSKIMKENVIKCDEDVSKYKKVWEKFWEILRKYEKVWESMINWICDKSEKYW